MQSNDMKSKTNDEECDNSIETSTSTMSDVVRSNESTSSSPTKTMLLSHSPIKDIHSNCQNQVLASSQHLERNTTENDEFIKEYGNQKDNDKISQIMKPSNNTNIEALQISDLQISDIESIKIETEKNQVPR